MRQKWLQKPPLGTPINWSHHLAKGLVGFWAFQEGGGDLANDLSGNANHGTLKNMAFPPTATSGWNAGRRGVGLNFDGTNDYVDCGSDASLDFGTANFSVAFWIKMSTIPDFTGYGIIQKQDTNVGWYIYVYGSGVGDGDMKFYHRAAAVSVKSKSTTIDDGVWHYTVFVRDGATGYLYLDGIDDTESTGDISASVNSSGVSCEIGRKVVGGVDDRYFKGQIDQVRIYNRALSAEEIKQLYLYPYACFQQPCTAWLYAAAAGGLSIPVAMHNYRRMRT